MAEGLRVLYVIDSLVPGGAETSLAAMAEHFPGLDIELHVAPLLDRPGLHDRFRAAGAQVHRIESGRLGRVGELRRLIGQIDAHIVHTTLFEADQVGRLAGWLAGRPVISSFVSTGFELGDPRSLLGVKARAAVAVDAMTVRTTSGLHAVSAPVAEFMAHRLRLSIDRFTVIPRGREPEELGRRDGERRRNVRIGLGLDDRPIVLVVGRHVRPKGHLTLVEALPSLVRDIPDVAVVFAGQPGPTSPELRRRVSALGLERHVVELGHRADIADLLAAADVLAHPSSREGFPGTLVEALALECPIVASDLPSIRAVVESDGELLADLVPAGNAPAFASALSAVLSSGSTTSLDRPRTQRGRQHFERHFTTAQVSQAFRQMYDDVLAKAPRNAGKDSVHRAPNAVVPIEPVASVSVVIPTLNAAETIGEQLDALDAQDFDGDWDIIVALQECDDDTEGVLRSRPDRRLRIADATAQRGASYARNVGARASRASHLAFCDADDIVAPDWLSELAARCDTGVVSGACVKFDDPFDPSEVDRSSSYMLNGNQYGFLPGLLSGNLLVQRTILEEVGWFDPMFPVNEDDELAFRLQTSGYTIRYAPDAIVYYRQRARPQREIRQRFRWARYGPALYRRYRAAGMPPRGVDELVRDARRLVAHLLHSRDPEHRHAFMIRGAEVVGRMVGSVRERVLYL